MGKGDTLAAGGVRATFQPAKVTQEEWDARVGKQPIKRKRKAKKS